MDFSRLPATMGKAIIKGLLRRDYHLGGVCVRILPTGMQCIKMGYMSVTGFSLLEGVVPFHQTAILTNGGGSKIGECVNKTQFINRNFRKIRGKVGVDH